MTEKYENFTVPGLGSVRFTLQHKCRTLRSARAWKKEFERDYYVRIEKEAHYYKVYTRRK